MYTCSRWPIYTFFRFLCLSFSNFLYVCLFANVFIDLFLKHFAVSAQEATFLIANYIDRKSAQKLFTHALHALVMHTDYSNTAGFQFEFSFVQLRIHTDPLNNQSHWFFSRHLIDYLSHKLFLVIFLAVDFVWFFPPNWNGIALDFFSVVYKWFCVIHNQGLAVKLQSYIINLAHIRNGIEFYAKTTYPNRIIIDQRCCVQNLPVSCLLSPLCLCVVWSFCINCAILLCTEMKKRLKQRIVSCFPIESV